MPLTLGEKLRQAREKRGISISEVSEQTRISHFYLESIENNDYKPLPGGIFNKGFVKSYAKFIGLDEHEALQDYARIVAENEGSDEHGLKLYKPEVLTDDKSANSMVPTIIFAGIILALMTGGVLFLVNYLRNSNGDSLLSVTTNSPSPQNSNSSIPLATPAANTPTFDEIKVEFTALSERISLSANIDGRPFSETVEPNSPKTLKAKNSLKLSYYRGFADKVGLTLNGKKIAPPPPPAKGIAISFEINRDNVQNIWQAGAIEFSAAASPEIPAAELRSVITSDSPETKEVSNKASGPTASPSQPVLLTRPRSVEPTPPVNTNANRTASPRPTGTASPSPSASPRRIRTPVVRISPGTSPTPRQNP